MEDYVVPRMTQFAVASWLSYSIYCITNITVVGMEHTMANISSSSSVVEHGFMSCFVWRKVNQTEETKLRKLEKKQILQILRYDCSGGR